MFFKVFSNRSRLNIVFTPSLVSNLFNYSFDFYPYSFVSFNYDIHGLRGHVTVAQRHGDTHLEAEAEDGVRGVWTAEVSREQELEGNRLTPDDVSFSDL